MRRKLRYFYSIEFSRVFCLSFAVASKTSGLEATRAIVFGETVEAIEESTTHVLTIKVALAVEATETVGILVGHTITVIVKPIVVAETVVAIEESTTHVLTIEVALAVGTVGAVAGLIGHTITVIVKPIMVAETVEAIKESTTHVLLVEVEIGVVLSLERALSSPTLEVRAKAARGLSQGDETN